MVCPGCGRPATVSAGRCAECGATLLDGKRRLLKDGIAGDEAVQDTLHRAANLNALAEVYEAQGQTAVAVSAARSVLTLGKSLRRPIRSRPTRGSERRAPPLD